MAYALTVPSLQSLEALPSCFIEAQKGDTSVTIVYMTAKTKVRLLPHAHLPHHRRWPQQLLLPALQARAAKRVAAWLATFSAR